MKFRSIFFSAAALMASLVVPAQATFLFADARYFPIPAFASQSGTLKQYSEWDVFYAPYGEGNYPDVAAPHGGAFVGGVWKPVQRSAAGFPANDPVYNPNDPLAFWDAKNATITQSATSAFIIGPDSLGNIYSFAEKTNYVLRDSTADATTPFTLGTVQFQFQTDGTTVDFSSIFLRYTNGTGTHQIAATEYLREFLSSTSADSTAVNAFQNRVSLQWNLTGLNINTYEIVWSSESSSMSFQKAVLDTSDTYGAGVPASRTWTAVNGTWSTGANWAQGTTSVDNGNVKFANAAAATVSLDSNRTIGELILQSAANVTINRPGSQKIVSNTGISTTTAATGTYTINTAWEFGATNVFELNAGIVRLNGPVTGNYGLLKKGNGTLVLGGVGSFVGGITLWGGTLRIEGANTYAGGTAVVLGRLEIAANSPLGSAGALGTSSATVNLGSDGDLFSNTGGGAAEIMIDGDRTVAQGVAFAAGTFQKRLGAFGTATGATYSGAVNFGTASNVKLTAQAANDRVTFSGAMTGGAAANTLAVDGLGTVVLGGGTAKTFASATTVAAGTLEVATGTAFTGAGNWQVSSGARLRVNGTFAGAGTLTLNGGTLTGAGTVTKNILLDTGDRIAPGAVVGTITLSGAQTWAGGGGYEWQIANAPGAGGTNWDLVQITGALNLTATVSDRFTIYVSSVTLAGLGAPLGDFNPSASYQWLLATASGGISGFTSGEFLVDASAFSNAPGGQFSVTQMGNSLFLNYSAVPEPGTWMLLGLAGALLVGLRCGAIGRKQNATNR